jgi:hypothetical protein
LSTSTLRAASTTRAPAVAAIRAVTSPMPLLAPVMTITCSAKGFNETMLRSCFWVSANGGGAGMFQLGREVELVQVIYSSEWIE